MAGRRWAVPAILIGEVVAAALPVMRRTTKTGGQPAGVVDQRSSTSRSTEGQVAGRNFQMIDFARERDGTFDHATVSMLDGVPRVSWTSHRGASKTERQAKLSEAEFNDLWEPLNDPVFQKCFVRSMGAEMDFRNNYVVGVTYNVDGDAGLGSYRIPDAERDPAWVKWLAKLRSTNR